MYNAAAIYKNGLDGKWQNSHTACYSGIQLFMADQVMVRNEAKRLIAKLPTDETHIKFAAGLKYIDRYNNFLKQTVRDSSIRISIR